MKWQTNQEITQNKIHEIFSYINKDLLIARLCYMLNIDTNSIFSYITEEELENLISSILINRGIDNKEKIDLYVNNIEQSILSPYNLVNAELAADKIIDFMEKDNATIYIYGDYDVDGVMSVFILVSVLKALTNNNIVFKMPERSDGYGLSIDYCNTIINNEIDNYDNVLVITVDNGITKKNEVELLKSKGIEVVITDHHESKKDEVPNCIVVDPHNSEIEQDETYHHLCGAGVIFKVCQIIQEKYNQLNMLQYTPYLSLATLADVMPLTSENSAIIQYGLEVINSDNCPKSIKELMNKNSINILTTNDILWTIAPMINACGRMGNTALASKFVFEDGNISNIVDEIIKTNDSRKDYTKKAQKELFAKNYDDKKVCIYINEKYPNGILGILAGKLAERFNKPAIVCALSEDGFYHGSVRSCNGINILELFVKMKEMNIIRDFGGHSESCAVSFDIQNLDLMNKFFDENIIEVTQECEEEIVEKLNVDEIIDANYLTDIVYAISNILPCDNRLYQYPVYALTNVKVTSSKRFNSGYTEIMLQQDNTIFEVSMYGDLADKYQNEILPNLKGERLVNIAGSINKKSFFSSRFQRKVYTLDLVDIMIA